jgi:hypothetical protein
LLKLLHRWREEAEKAGRRIERIAVAFEAGRDGFWLARWLKARGIEAYVIHASSVAVMRSDCPSTDRPVPLMNSSPILIQPNIVTLRPVRILARAFARASPRFFRHL